MNRHQELEYKFAADRLPMRFFEALMEAALPDETESVTHDDVFYKRGANIVRHRLVSNGELTVKARKSQDSLRDRVEVNLRFAPETTQEDVEAFLLATGYEKLFTLRKLHVRVYKYRFPSADVEVAIYTVGRVDNWGISNVRQFVEVEMKNKELPEDDALYVLESWKDWLQRQLGLAEPLNESLLEIYTATTSPSINYHI